MSKIDPHAALTSVTMDDLQPGTRAAVRNLIDLAVEKSYGKDVEDMAKGATMLAMAGLDFDLREKWVAANGADHGEAGFKGYREITLRILVRKGLEERLCQMDKLVRVERALSPHDVPCKNYYEEDVPPIDGALMCGNHYIQVYRVRNGIGQG